MPRPSFAQLKWWHSDRFQKDLKMSRSVTRIEGIFQASEPLLRAQRILSIAAKRNSPSPRIRRRRACGHPATDRLELARNEMTAPDAVRSALRVSPGTMVKLNRCLRTTAASASAANAIARAQGRRSVQT